MNYCSISDAWGNKNNNIENFQPHNNIEKFHSYSNTNNNNNTIEHFKPLNNKKYTKVKNKMSCDEILEHIQNCRHCNEILRLKYNSNSNSNSNSNFIENLTKNNKDTCILILVAIFVYLFFKLLNKI